MTTIDAAEAPRTAWGATWRALLAMGAGMALWAAETAVAAQLEPPARAWFWWGDPALAAVLTAVVLLFVRRAPVLVAAAAAVGILFSVVAVGPALLALASVATRRRWWEIVAVAAVDLTVLLIGALPYWAGGGSLPWWVRAVILGLGIGMVVAVGIGVGQRRALLTGLRARAEQAEREQAAREESAKAAERNRIAHDMHDVLAHRISLVAMQSSALAFRDDVDGPEQKAMLETIGENARMALSELRDVLGVLRESGAGEPEPPQPHLTDLGRLVQEARSAGMSVESVLAVEGEPPSVVGQSAYRVVREALTNARKHAPGSEVIVSVAGEAGEGLAVRVTNGPARVAAPALAGSGLGLVAMRERVERTGGRITTGIRPDGGFELSAWLPWAR